MRNPRKTYPVKVLTPEQITEVRSKYKDGLTITDLSGMYFCSRATIHRSIADGSRPIKRRPAGPLGSGDVTTDEIIELREVHGLSYAKIGAKVMLSPSTVQSRYKHARPDYEPRVSQVIVEGMCWCGERYTGARKHRNKGEQPCNASRIAENLYCRDYKRQRKLRTKG